MKLAHLVSLLPLVAAFRLPTNPGDVFVLAGDMLAETPESVLTPASDITLASIPNDEHYTITSAMHPDHMVRIKSTEGWCDPNVKSFTGYLDVGGGKDLFFYFFESRGNPKEDPIIMWINGGPGCSSSIGLFMELGPCTVADNPKTVNDTKPNPYSWNEHANIFFVDEPVNVGFSQARNGQVVGTAEEAGQDIAAFIDIWFDTFKEFRGREFHMAGESYGGRYLPVFASAVYDQNKMLVAQGKEPINLKSIMIGNGITSSYTTTESYFPYQCTVHADLNHTVQSIGKCIEMAESLPRCKKMLKKDCIESHDATSCSIAAGYCSETIGSSFLYAGVNPYDVSKPCTLEELSDSLCYPETKKIGTYLNLPDVRKYLGVEKEGQWDSCDNGVGRAFAATLDASGQTWLYVSQLLERGVAVLNYVGTLDFICNYIGNEMWMEALEWTGKDQYNAAEYKKWDVDGEHAGEYKGHGKLTFLKIWGAGHMVPMDQPKHSLSFLDHWLKNGKVE
ncbi:hypothetical protein CspHIS471_0600810 [Cutaneotrichosporon sp. HIS471]|nr:hypothetical protein CspHIS471_0600810 [Cutaneotrichosporon sp. HIS471]